MRIPKSAVIIFLITFLIGSVLVTFVFNYVSILKTKKEFILPVATTVILEQQPTQPITPKLEQKSDDESDDKLEWVETYDAKYKIKLLEIGESFHGDEVKAKSGETWLGLFKQDDEFSLRSTKVKIKRVLDEFVDEKPNLKTGKAVSVEGKTQPIFLLKNAGFLKQGKIKTLFYGDEENFSEETNINNKTDKTFTLNDTTYRLFVINKKGKDEYLDETSKLVLTDSKIEQTIYSQKMCDDCGWGIYWVGDLDGDGKLDLFLDLANHYNVRQWRLFLSSQAAKGNLVKEVANFRIVGC